MTTILVTGSKGQLGSDLKDLSGNHPVYRFLFTDVDELDITDLPALSAYFEKEKPDVVINCAAYTAVDKAEDEPERAFQINAEAAGYIAEACTRHHCFLFHISTDYVFDGTTPAPIKEDRETAPASVYGHSKLEGERQVIARAEHGMIIRTSWLYSSYGSNFVKTILRLARERGALKVVNDQTGTPTYSRDLAEAILTIVPLRERINGVEIFHYANEGIVTWHGFAEAILHSKGVACTVTPIPTKDYPAKAKRPMYSVLSTDKIKTRFGITIPGWKDSMERCLKKIP